MKLTRSINLQGVVLNIDDDAYQLLKDYLADIESRLPQDEQKDVIDDLESRIAELLQSALFVQKSESVTIDMVRSVRTRIGEPDEFGENKRPIFKRQPITRQGVGRVLSIVLKAILIIIAVQVLYSVFGVILAMLMAFFGVSIGGIALMPALSLELLGIGSGWLWLLWLSVIAALGIPLYMIVHAIVKYSRQRRLPGLRFWIISVLIWIMSICGMAASLTKIVKANGTNLETVFERLENIADDEEFISDTRSVEPFHAVSLSGAVKAEISVGEPQSLEVRYTFPGKVETSVEDGVLHVQGIGNHSGKVTICVPTLDALAATGATKVDMQGAADELNIDLSGASRLDAEELTVRDMHITVTGASKADVNVTGSLWAQAHGASKIEYRGNPDVQECVSLGASKITKD